MSTIITAIVETPKGKGLKYDFDPLLGCFKLNKVMPAGLVFPYDFGYIPGTTGGDGDPVDILVLSELETFSGCAIDCRIIGGIKASQREPDGEQMRNDRIIAVADVSRLYAYVNKLADLPRGVLDELESFFRNYNEQAGKIFKPLERLSAKQAVSLVEKAKSEAMKDTLVQLFLPQSDHSGQPFPASFFSRLNHELQDKFGEFTVCHRSPAEGIWTPHAGNTVSESLIVYEVLIHAADSGYWRTLKSKLAKQFAQQEILILLTKVSKV